MFVGYIDGVFKPSHTLSLPVGAFAIERGYGAFETVRLYGQIPLDLNGHLNRLIGTCEAICLDLPLSKSELTDIFLQVVSQNPHKDYCIKILATQQQANTSLVPYHLVLAPFALPPQPITPLKLTSTSIQRSFANHKTTAYLEGIVAEKKAQAAGYDSIAYVDPSGTLLEGLKSNLFAIRGHDIYTASENIVKGITRKTLIQSLKESPYTVHEHPIFLKEAKQYDALFLTSTLLEVFPVQQLDQIQYTQLGIIKSLQSRFHQQKDLLLQTHLQTS